MTDCLFCRIISKKIPAQIVAESEKALAFQDIHPQAPTHILVVPKQHIASVRELEPSQAYLLGEVTLLAQQVAQEQDLEDYRLVMNTGVQAGQTVFHLHMHVLGGRLMAWPPG